MIDVGAEKPGTPKFIVDAPAVQDELSAHQRIANSVVEVLREDERIKLIGLLGGWGSGKSTVVRLIELGLRPENGADIRCFNFDAWEHQSDPPRRAFLEAFAFFLRTDDGFPHLRDRKKTWRKKLDALNRQREKTRTKTTPTLTRPGAWYLISLVGLTIGLRLIGDGTLSETDQRDLWVWVVFLTGWGLIAGPLIVFVVTWASWRSKPRAAWSWFTQHKKGRRKHSLLAIFANKQVDTRQELKLRSPEPSAMEFQTVFRDFVSDALSEGARLVVVIDNLDRLPADEAMTIWSTVRSLFLGSDHEQQIPRDKLPTVIMPIDELALRRIYKDKPGEDGLLAQSFIEKTFDLVFHVPQPVLSRWHGYLRTRISEVFGTPLHRDWLHAIASAYEGWLAARPSLNGPDGATRTAVPTPREINALVNAIAVIWLQRRDEAITMDMIAYFAVWRREIDDLHGHLERDPNRRNFSEKQKLQLAALVYGVDLDDAAELFLEEPLKLAMEGRDQERFNALMKFDRHVLRFFGAAAEAEEVLPAFYAAELLREVPDLPDAWSLDAWALLRKLAVYRAGVELTQALDLPGLDALVERCPRTRVKAFINAFSARMTRLPNAATHSEKAETFALVARRLADHAEAAGMLDFVVRYPGGDTRYANLLRLDIDPATLRVIVPETDNLNKVIDQIGAQAIVSGTRRDAAPAVKRLLARGPEDLSWFSVITSATTLIETRRSDGMADAVRTLFALYLGPPEVHSEVTRQVLSGYIETAHQWLWANGQEMDALAESTTLLMRSNRPAPSGDHRGWQDQLQDHPDLASLIHDRLTSTGFRPSLAWAMARLGSSPYEAPLLSALVAIWIDDMELDAAAVFADPATAGRLVPLDAQPAFWRRMSAADGFSDFVKQLPIDQAAPVYRALRKSGGSQSTVMRSLSDRFRNTSEDEWLNVLETGFEPFGLVTELQTPTAKSANAGPTAHAALMRSAGTVIARDDDAYRARWFALAARLSPAARSTLYQSLATTMLSTPMSGRRIRDIFEAAGPQLLNEGGFLSQADRAVVQLVFPMVADDMALSWLVANVTWIRRWIEASKRTTKGALREQVVSRLFQGAGEARLLALSLGYAKADGSVP